MTIKCKLDVESDYSTCKDGVQKIDFVFSLSTKFDQILKGFHGMFAMGVACQQRMLPPIWGIGYVQMLRHSSLSQHSSVLLYVLYCKLDFYEPKAIM